MVAGTGDLTTRSGGRRRKSAKARSRGQLGTGWQRVLWGFDAGGDLDGGRDTNTTRPTCLHAGQAERLQWAPRQALGAHQRAIGALIDMIWSKGTVAGAEQRIGTGKWRRSRSPVHDVSILIGVGLHLGSEPRAKTSMTIMRAPQRGHEQGSTRGASGVTSGCCCGLTAGGAPNISANK
jgi:hypothetical protein